MKILHVVRQFFPLIGGIENYVYHLANFQAAKNTVTVLTLNRSFADGKLLPAYEKLENFDIIRIPYSGSHKYPLAFSVLKYVRDYDIIHVHCVDFFSDYLSLTKILHRKKLVITTHGGFFHTKSLYLVKTLFFNLVSRLTLKSYSHIIACGDNDYMKFRKISNKVLKIDNGINVKPFIAVKKDLKAGLLLYVGRIDHHKRIDRLINIVKNLRDSGENVHLRIIGPDWSGLRPSLEKHAERLQVNQFIEFTGAVSDYEIIRSYQEAHVFMSASEYEGFGISAIEALASGTLSVVHLNDSFRKLFADKSYSVLANFEDDSKTAEKVKEILRMDNNKYNELSEKARQYASTFSWEHVEKKITGLYMDKKAV